MIIFRTSAEITADRSVVIALPSETPLGKAELTVTVSPAGDTTPPGGNLRRHFAAVCSGNPQSADNDRIDRDLAQSYQQTNE